MAKSTSVKTPTANTNVTNVPFRTLSALIDRIKLAARAGLQFEGERDLYAIFGYKKTLQTQDLFSRYLRQDIASRIVEIYASGTWSDPPLIRVASNQAFEKAWTALTKQHKLWSAFNRVDKLCNLGRYAVLLLGFDDKLPLDQPVAGGPGRRLMYVKPLMGDSAPIKAYENDPTNERFGQPTMYEVSLQDLSEKASSTGIELPTNTAFATKTNIRVHYTRIVHVVEDPLEDDTYGNPRLVKLYNLLDDLLKIAGGTAETFWLTANRGLHLNIDKEMEVDPDDAAALAASAEEYQHQLRRILKTRGVDVNVLESSTPNPSGGFDMLMTLVAGAAGIPRRILFGSEAGQLASEQDRASWARRLTERRMEFANPYVIIPFIKSCQMAGVLPMAEPEEMEIKWNDAFHLSPLEKAMTMAQTARAMVNMSRQAQLGFPLANQAECRQVLGLEGTIDQDQIELAKWWLEKQEAEAALATRTAEEIEFGDDNNPDEPGSSGSRGGIEEEPSDRPARQRQVE